MFRRRWRRRAHEPRQRRHRSGVPAAGPSVLPFADAATPELPMSRLLRLSLFQVTVGMAAVLLIGTLNRVMIVELSVPVLDRRRDARAAAAVRAAARADRVSLGSPSLGARLAPRALHLVRHDGAVRRLCDHAVRAAHSFRRHHGSALGRPGRGRAGVSACRRRFAHGSDRGPRLGDRPCARTRAPPRRRAALRDAACRHGGQRDRLRRLARPFQRGAPHSGRPGRRGGDDGAQLRCALEAGAAQTRSSPRKSRRRPAFSTPGTSLRQRGARAAA